MPIPWAPILTAAGTGIQNIFNARQASRQMDFQREMSNTSYQRSRADMAAAGMNPYMAHSMGGAQSGSGASATMGNDPLSAGVSSALSSQLMRAQIDKTNAEARSAQADAALKTQASIDPPGTPPGERRLFTWFEEQEALRAARIRDAGFGGVRNDMERGRYDREGARFNWDKARQPVDQQRAELELLLRGLDRNESEAYSGYYGRTGWQGILAEKGAGVVKDLAGAVGSVGGAVNGSRAAKKAAAEIARRLNNR